MRHGVEALAAQSERTRDICCEQVQYKIAQNTWCTTAPGRKGVTRSSWIAAKGATDTRVTHANESLMR